MSASPFFELPVDTARAAKSLYSQPNAYISIGDRLAEIAARVQLNQLDEASGQPTLRPSALALITLFQSGESLSDRQAAEAVRQRLDWKYALHLNLSFPGVNPASLCFFRYRLYSDTTAQHVLQTLNTELVALGLGSNAWAAAEEIIQNVCQTNRLEWLVEAMSVALESLASSQPKWLLRVTRPHWYHRYRRDDLTKQLPENNVEREVFAKAIGQDIQHLLHEIQASGNPLITSMPELLKLESTWREQFEKAEAQLCWRTPNCHYCLRNQLTTQLES